MTVSETRPALHLPARDIPVPSSVSAEAQAVLAAGPMEAAESPPLDDIAGWRAMIAARDEALLPFLTDRASRVAADVEAIDADGVSVFVITPHDVPSGDERVFFEIHGGAMIWGGGACCRAMGMSTAARVGVRVWTVDYRMPPDHPYPVPLDDCDTAYRVLLRDHRPADIIVGGASAGGNLAAALMLRAQAEGLPLPAAAVLLTPQLDLTESGDSFQTNRGLDTVITGSSMPNNLLYADGHDLADPFVSPLFGDFSKGFPPTFLATGTRDLFLSNTVRMHRALRTAGVEADLHVMEAAPHGGFFGSAPEDAELEREVRRFVDAHWTT